jgi:hypothetical protein
MRSSFWKPASLRSHPRVNAFHSPKRQNISIPKADLVSYIQTPSTQCQGRYHDKNAKPKMLLQAKESSFKSALVEGCLADAPL